MTLHNRAFWFLCAVLLLVNLYSFSTLTTKPAYWYDEAINVELAHNFSEFGNLDLIIAPNMFSGQGATVGSTGYPVTVPLAGFFKVFGFGIEQARVYMLLWMSALLVAFFSLAKKLRGSLVAYGGTALIATFAPFYGNGRSVMGEIPGFLFFLLSFYALERKKPCLSGILLGLAVVSKPSVFVFLIPAYSLVLLCGSVAWREKLVALLRLGLGSLLALLPWLAIYAGELTRGGIWENIFNHFKNPYQEAGISAWTNISHNLGTFFQSTTLLYFTVLLVLVIAALYLNRELFRTHRSIFILSAVYVPLVFLQYLKSFGYLRYLIAAEFLVFMLFAIALPVVVRWVLSFCHRHPAAECVDPVGMLEYQKRISLFSGMTVAAMIFVQVIHLFWFSDLYFSDKTQKTIAYISREYPSETVGVFNLPQIGSFLPAGQKYQYLSTYGLWQFGTNPLLLSEDNLPRVLILEGMEKLSADERDRFSSKYEKDTAFSDGFSVYRKK